MGNAHNPPHFSVAGQFKETAKNDLVSYSTLFPRLSELGLVNHILYKVISNDPSFKDIMNMYNKRLYFVHQLPPPMMTMMIATTSYVLYSPGVAI